MCTSIIGRGSGVGTAQVQQSGPRQAFRVYNPIGFDPSAYLPSELARLHDCARYFVHLVAWRSAFAERVRNGYVTLMAELVRAKFPGSKAYMQVKDCLLGHGLLECDNSYFKGDKAKGYRLGPALRGRRFAGYTLTDRVLLRKLRSGIEEREKSLSELHHHLDRHLHTLSIDHPAALAWLRENGHDDTDEFHIDLIRDRFFRSKFCAFGRFHTNLTNLRRELRGFLTSGGEELVNLDVRNSQPLIFGILLNKEHPEGRGRPADVARYIDLVQEGRFYEHMMGVADFPATTPARWKDKKDQWTDEAGRRCVFKRKMFAQVFYDTPEHVTPLTEAFADQFPTVSETIRRMKSRPGPAGFKAFNHEMQRAESAVMLSRVATRCKDEIPAAFVATIHDSVVTTPDRAETVRRMMHQEFAVAGLRPSIEVVPLARPSAPAL